MTTPFSALPNNATPHLDSLVAISEATTDPLFVSQNMTIRQLMTLARGFFFGSANYQDTATAVTPIVGVGGVPYVLTNNGAGAQSYDDLPGAVTPLWVPGTSSFDFSSLNPIDILRVRIDLEVTTTAANQEVQIYLQLGIGGIPYQAPLASLTHKTAGTIAASKYTMLHMVDLNTINNPAQIKIVSAAATNVVVRGWAVDVDLRAL